MPHPKLPSLAPLGVALLLAGCVGGLPFAMPQAAMQGFRPSDPALATPAKGGSTIIDDLRSRHSILPAGGPYAAIAQAVSDAAAGASEAELRMARLKAEARAKNWLPTIGPTVSLTSLGSVVAQLVIDQAILDHGRRKAERDHAAADVEVAAVMLVEDLNGRVHDGLSAWLTAEQARAQAAVAEQATTRLIGFEDIVTMRVNGGLSDQSERQVIAQSRAEMAATLSNDRQTLAQALSDLSSLTNGRIPQVSGIDRLDVPAAGPAPLSVLRAQAEGSRTLAEARMARAGLLPGLSAQAAVDGSGGISPSLTLGGARLGLGTGAEARALDAAPELVERRTAQARADADRQTAALHAEIAALRARQEQGAAVLAQTRTNLDLFNEQYRMGRRSLLELVSQFDAAARMERDQVALAYEIARIELRIARDRGLLLDGARM